MPSLVLGGRLFSMTTERASEYPYIIRWRDAHDASGQWHDNESIDDEDEEYIISTIGWLITVSGEKGHKFVCIAQSLAHNDDNFTGVIFIPTVNVVEKIPLKCATAIDAE